MSGSLEMSGSRQAGAAWADQRPTGTAAKLSFHLEVMYCVAGHSILQVLGSPGKSAAAVVGAVAAAAAPTPAPETLLNPCMLLLQAFLLLC